MALTKTLEEIDALRRGGALLSKALGTAVQAAKPGTSLKELDAIAEEVIRAGGGVPSFKGYQISKHDPPFPSTLCISVNEEVVHGLGNRERLLEEGDLVGLDIGLWLEDLCTDMAVTIPIGAVSDEEQNLLRVTRESLLAGIEAARVGNQIADIGAAVESVVNPHGYGIVRALVGHGVGHAVHESPQVPNFTHPSQPNIPITPNMVLAIEPMIGLGGYEVETADDGWSICMADGKRSAHFEATIAVLENGPEILTPLPV